MVSAVESTAVQPVGGGSKPSPRVPLDVIFLIIQLVHRQSFVGTCHYDNGPYEQQKLDLTFSQTDEGIQRQVMPLENREPVLGPLQTLALVNRQIYELCRPLLWKVSSVTLDGRRTSIGTESQNVVVR